jgi:nifR3 family TIM-barrel protein
MNDIWENLRMKFILAPLAGFTNAAFRTLCLKGGADLVYTEMVSMAGLAHSSNPTRHLMEVLPDEKNTACQIFGSKPHEAAIAAKEVSKTGYFTSINLNCGCPMPKVVREGAGAALIHSPELIHDCLVAMKSVTSLPVTLKTRPGPKPDNIKMFEILSAAEDAGATEITLHARFTSQAHGGEVHLKLLAELVSRAKIPVIGNGSVVDVASAKAMEETGVAGIMIGRAALNDPFIFARLKGAQAPEFTPDVRKKLFHDHIDLLIKLYSQIKNKFPSDYLPTLDSYVSGFLRTHLFRYFSGLRGAAEIRRHMNDIHTVEDVMKISNIF